MFKTNRTHYYIYIRHKAFCLSFWTALLLLTLSSCSDNKEKDEVEIGQGDFIITEVMAANHTGLLAKDGKTYDWIELKNISDKTASLKNYSLSFEKTNKKETSTDKRWKFPDIEVEPGKYIIVFASKDNINKEGNELHASFKLSASGGTIQLRRKKHLVSKVCYGPMEDDMCYRFTPDSTFEASYEQTPGFENTNEGFEAYCSLLEQQRTDSLKIWEVHSKGHKTGQDWIEIKNISSKPINLEGYKLTTSKKSAPEWNFPAVEIQPGALYVVNCRKENFKIGSSKSLILSKKGKFIDGVCPVATRFGVSMGRVKGKSGFFYFPSPTRSAENTTTSYRHIAQEPSFYPMPNVYSRESMNVSLNTKGHTIRYTTDGSGPTFSSPIYRDSLNLRRTTIIRAFCEGDSTTLRSNTVTATYIFDQEHTLPSMNITVPEVELYDFNRGIYVEGPNAAPEHPHQGANYWKAWWKRAHIEFYDTINGGFSAPCELAIFGGFSRALPKKSFKIRFRDEYGPAHIDYDLYNEGKVEEVKKFVLRSGSQDISHVMVRDEFFTSLMHEHSPNLLIQAYRPIVLYINGKYFGIYYIREKIDKGFVARHLNVSTDSISIIMSGMYCEEGTKKDFQALLNYASSHNLADEECYNYVKDRLDLEGFIDYKLGQMYSCNTDLGNVRYVQSKDPKGDKKWHIVFYDLDATWVASGSPAAYLSAGGDNKVMRIQNILAQELLKNPEFRQLFLERLSLHMHKTFSTENATAVFDNLINTIKPEMPRNCERWPSVLTYPRWEARVKDFREKFKDRNKNMLNDLRKWLSITEEENKKYFSDLDN